MKYVFCFDGTSNKPSDAKQAVTDGVVQDKNITNVRKLYLLLDGLPEQTGYYYRGVGTYGGIWNKLMNLSMAISDMERILDQAMSEVQRVPDDGKIYVLGFSRGAALARRFAALVAKSGRPIEFLGAFDTVAAIGLPDLDTDTRPDLDTLYEEGAIHPLVKEAYHFVSIDERRLAFQPTLMSCSPRVTEVWFAGVHTDIGGGFYNDGLGDITLISMKDKLTSLGIKFRNPKDVLENPINGLTIDDLKINPNPRGVIHAQHRFWPVSTFTLHDRKVVVTCDGKITNIPPLVHWSVVDRMASMNYKPPGLNLFKVWYPNSGL